MKRKRMEAELPSSFFTRGLLFVDVSRWGSMDDQFDESEELEKYFLLKEKGVDCRKFLEEFSRNAQQPEVKFEALCLLAHECSLQKDLSGAEKALLDCLDLFPEDPGALTGLARFYAFSKGEFTKSWELLDRALLEAENMSEGVVSVLFDLVEVSLLANDPEQLRTTVQRLSEFRGDFEEWEVPFEKESEILAGSLGPGQAEMLKKRYFRQS